MAVIYSAHWRAWSRVLSDKDGVYVELNLSHINGMWDKVKEETIREHRTTRSPKDVEQENLPVAVKQAMVAVLGAKFVERLLTYDYLSEVDWAKYKKIANGGAAFNQIRKLEYV
jgi:hypothetical protein